MKKRSWFTPFLMIFAITLMVTVGVTLLWNLIVHGEAQIDWETSFRFAIIFAIVIPLLKRWNHR